MGDSRCLHLKARRKRHDGSHFIRLNVAGAKMMAQFCPACHAEMRLGGVVKMHFQNSGARKIRGFRRYPGDVAPVWFEVQVI